MADKMIGKELLVVSSRESTKKPGSGWKIRLVQWIKDGKSLAVKLECGEYWTDEASGEMRFKAKGFAKKDLEACKPHWSAIMALMTTPPPVEAAAPAGEGSDDPGF